MPKAQILSFPPTPEEEGSAQPPAWYQRPLNTLKTWLQEERRNAFHGLPICLAAGSASYFALPFEPPIVASIAALIALCFCFFVSRFRRVSMVAVLAVLLGFLLAQAHTKRLNQPLIDAPRPAATYFATVAAIERRVEGGWRITLEKPQSPGENAVLPDRVRITVRTDIDETVAVGTRVKTKAVLLPLPKPVLPGGYDFGRALYFKGIGATGFAVSGIEVLPSPNDIAKTSQLFESARSHIREAVSRVLTGDTKAVALALLTGDRSGLSAQTKEAFRQAGLAYLLAISGLHMALIGSAVFFAVRRGLSLWPRLALLLPLKTLAAGATLLVLLLYLGLVGAPVSAQRATIMAGIAMIAIMVGRNPVSMRTAAFAAVALLILAPHSVLDIGFQMSFTAVIALIAGYEALAPRLAGWRSTDATVLRGPLLYIAGVFASTILAEAALTPLTIFHFNEVTTYGLAGNALAVPLTGFVVMPAGLLGLVLMPLGLSDPAFWLMGQGIDLMTAAANDIAQQPYALLPVRRFSVLSHILLVTGFFWLCLLKTKLRLLSLAFFLAAGTFAAPPRLPTLVVNDTGSSIAVRGPKERMALVAGRSTSFSADVWARSFGQTSLDFAPADINRCDAVGCSITFQGEAGKAIEAVPQTYRRQFNEPLPIRVDVLKSPSGWSDTCQSAHVVIVRFPSSQTCPPLVITLTQDWLERNGPAELRLTVANIRNDTTAPKPLYPLAQRSDDNGTVPQTQATPSSFDSGLVAAENQTTNSTVTAAEQLPIEVKISSVNRRSRPWTP